VWSTQNKFVQALSLLPSSREVIGSSSGRDIDYPDCSFTWFLSFPPGKCQDLSIYGYTALYWALAAFSVSWSFYTVGRTTWTGVQPVARPLPTHRTTQTQNKRTQTSMPRVGFEPTIPVFERAKTVHALDGAATVIGICWDSILKKTRMLESTPFQTHHLLIILLYCAL
jgi:hypothetical protein